MDQAAKLEPFLLLAKNAKGKSAAEVINRATEEPGIYGFGELLDIAGIKEVIFDEEGFGVNFGHALLCMPQPLLYYEPNFAFNLLHQHGCAIKSALSLRLQHACS